MGGTDVLMGISPYSIPPRRASRRGGPRWRHGRVLNHVIRVHVPNPRVSGKWLKVVVLVQKTYLN